LERFRGSRNSRSRLDYTGRRSIVGRNQLRRVSTMARARPLKERTVAFYEVVEEKAGEQLRMSQLPWVDTLASIAVTNVDGRTVEAESVFVGNVVTVDEEDHLLLHRVKGAAEWLSVLNWDTGEWRELESRAREGFLDTSVV